MSLCWTLLAKRTITKQMLTQRMYSLAQSKLNTVVIKLKEVTGHACWALTRTVETRLSNQLSLTDKTCWHNNDQWFRGSIAETSVRLGETHNNLIYMRPVFTKASEVDFIPVVRDYHSKKVHKMQFNLISILYSKALLKLKRILPYIHTYLNSMTCTRKTSKKEPRNHAYFIA